MFMASETAEEDMTAFLGRWEQLERTNVEELTKVFGNWFLIYLQQFLQNLFWNHWQDPEICQWIMHVWNGQKSKNVHCSYLPQHITHYTRNFLLTRSTDHFITDTKLALGLWELLWQSMKWSQNFLLVPNFYMRYTSKTYCILMPIQWILCNKIHAICRILFAFIFIFKTTMNKILQILQNL